MSSTESTRGYLKSALSVLSKTQRRTFTVLSLLRTTIFIVDLTAIVLLAGGVNAITRGEVASAVPRLAASVVMMFARSAATLFLSRSTFRFLARVEVQVGGKFTEAIFSASQELLDSFKSQDIAFALNQGTNSLTTRTLGFCLIAVSDAIALFSIVAFFLIMYPLEGFLLIVIILVSVLPIQRVVTRRIHESASKWADATIEMLQQVQEFQATRREIFLTSTSHLMAERLDKFRIDAAAASARFNFMLTVPRTIIEISTLAVTAILLLIAYLRLPSSEFVVFSAMLISITFRVAPLGIGITGAVGVITQSQGESAINRKIWQDIEHQDAPSKVGIHQIDAIVANSAISLEDVSYVFPGTTHPVVSDVNIKIAPNDVCALIGSSGSGKTTLLECMVGVRAATSGTVRVFGRTPLEIREYFPGFIGLVTQSPSISRGTFAENVALFSGAEIDRDLVRDLAHRVGLTNFLNKNEDGIDTVIGEGSLQMSGGEKQRLAIARALYHDPKILVMDEPTSALDGLSEEQVFELIASERKQRTIILVTHRRPPGFLFDCIFEISDGAVHGLKC